MEVLGVVAEFAVPVQTEPDLPDTGTGYEHIFSIPVTSAPSVFVRLKVASQ